MSENNQNRQFDWGPPASNGDAFGEWLLYLVMLAFLAMGVWVLLDVNAQKYVPLPAKPAKIKPAEAVADSPEAVLPQAPAEIAVPARFYVQLGAFADGQSATEVYDQLKADGFAPTLAPPDDQYEVHRILVGPFDSEKEAEDKAEKLNSLEFHCFVIESP